MPQSLTLQSPVQRPELSVRQGLWPGRMEMLDGWRGLAALTVVVHHVGIWNLGADAVMLFFVISGYCISAAAQSGLDKGIGFGQFMWRRVRRIYPPYILSVLFFVITRMIKTTTGGPNQLAVPWTTWVQNLTLTQWLSLMVHPERMAANNPSLFVAAYWSLNYEEQFYIVVGLMVLLLSWRQRKSLLGPTLMLMGASLLWVVAIPHICCGLFIEYWIIFAMGCLVYQRQCRMPDWRMRRLTDVAIGTMALVSGVIWWLVPSEGRPVARELCVASIFAFLLVVSRPLDRWYSRMPAGRVLSALGAISYSLYLIHQFNLNLVKSVADRLLPAWAPVGASVTLQVVGHVALATVFWYLFERPFLNKSQVAASPRPV